MSGKEPLESTTRENSSPKRARKSSTRGSRKSLAQKAAKALRDALMVARNALSSAPPDLLEKAPTDTDGWKWPIGAELELLDKRIEHVRRLLNEV